MDYHGVIVIQAVQSCSFEFVSDGISTSFSQDLSLQPVELGLKGSVPVAINLPEVTNTQAVSNPTATITLLGSTITVTFSVAPPKYDGNNALVVWTLTFQLVF